MSVLITGGAGFIGANFVLDWVANSDEKIVNLDKLTYAGNLESLASLKNNPQHVFVQGDIGDAALLPKLLAEHQPRAVLNFAAESHVDRSIHGPGEFIETNIVGTFRLLESVRGYWHGLSEEAQSLQANPSTARALKTFGWRVWAPWHKLKRRPEPKAAKPLKPWWRMAWPFSASRKLQPKKKYTRQPPTSAK